jgi:hypothetical protein
LKVSCPHCRAYIEVDANLAGEHIACPHCGGRLELPTPQPGAKPVAAPVEPFEGLNDESPQAITRRMFWSRLRRQTMKAVALVVGIVAVCVGAWIVFRAEPGLNPEKRGRTRCKEEEIVKKWVTDHAHDPASVEFDTWGPHDLQAELGVTWPPRYLARVQGLAGIRGGEKPEPAKVVRVSFRAKNAHGAKAFQDYLILLQNDKVVAIQHNQWDDDWKKGYKQQQDMLDQQLDPLEFLRRASELFRGVGDPVKE